MPATIIKGDCLEVMNGMEPGSVDLVFGSPPYEQARLYLEGGKNLGIARNTEAWVSWMVEVVKASLRVSRGLVAFVLEGQTKDFRWTASPALLMADLHRAGIHLRKPPIFHRIGIPGSGGPDWLRNDYEFIVCATNGGRLAWSDNTAMGSACKYPEGGPLSHVMSETSERVNAVYSEKSGRTLTTKRTSGRLVSHRDAKGYSPRIYQNPDIANPGNVIKCIVGGGHVGHPLAHDNEAPFPESLAEFFVRSFCPPGGTTLDPFSGSGTTVAVALANNRNGIGIDVRQSQVTLSRRRVEQVTPMALLVEDA